MRADGHENGFLLADERNIEDSVRMRMCKVEVEGGEETRTHRDPRLTDHALSADISTQLAPHSLPQTCTQLL